MSIEPLREKCGCVSSPSQGITFCALHAAAPEMLTVLGKAAETVGVFLKEPQSPYVGDRMRAIAGTPKEFLAEALSVIAKAEGRS